MRLTVTANPTPKTARLWVATGPTRDFRKATVDGEAGDDRQGDGDGLEPPTEGCKAFFGELDYEIDGIRYHLCTQMRVAGKPKP